MKILIVEDDKTFCRFLKEILQAEGHNVDSTSRAIHGYKMAQRKFYDLLIFDVRMPLLTGTELAEGLKEQFPPAKVILISAFADESLRNRARQIGVPILSKPFTAEKLLELVTETADQ